MQIRIFKCSRLGRLHFHCKILHSSRYKFCNSRVAQLRPRPLLIHNINERYLLPDKLHLVVINLIIFVSVNLRTSFHFWRYRVTTGIIRGETGMRTSLWGCRKLISTCKFCAARPYIFSRYKPIFSITLSTNKW